MRLSPIKIFCILLFGALVWATASLWQPSGATAIRSGNTPTNVDKESEVPQELVELERNTFILAARIQELSSRRSEERTLADVTDIAEHNQALKQQSKLLASDSTLANHPTFLQAVSLINANHHQARKLLKSSTGTPVHRRTQAMVPRMDPTSPSSYYNRDREFTKSPIDALPQDSSEYAHAIAQQDEPDADPSLLEQWRRLLPVPVPTSSVNKPHFSSIGLVYADGNVGTGTAIGPYAIMTCAHVLYDEAGNININNTEWHRQFHNGSTPDNRYPIRMAHVYVGANGYTRGLAQQQTVGDIALLLTYDRIPNYLTVLNDGRRALKANQRRVAPGYPTGQSRLYSDLQQNVGKLHTTLPSRQSLNYHNFGMNCTAEGCTYLNGDKLGMVMSQGSSGSPVLVKINGQYHITSIVSAASDIAKLAQSTRAFTAFTLITPSIARMLNAYDGIPLVPYEIVKL